MTPRRVFITGASGFIGRALAERYRALGAEVRGLDVTADPERGVLAGDTSMPGPWQRHAEGCDLVLHTAAIVSFRGSPDDFWGVNVRGTRHALDAAVRGGAERFVHLSSVTAFSFTFPDGVDERHPIRTNGSPYVDTKVASEQVVLQAHAAGELPCTVIRPGDVYGPGSRPWTVLPVQQIKAGRWLLPARGRGLMSPIYVDNLVDGMALAAEAPDAAGEVFTLTDGRGVSTADFFGRYARMLGKDGVPSLPNALAKPLAGAVYGLSLLIGATDNEINPTTAAYLSRTGTYSIAKARGVLGYEPKVGLDEGFARTERWLAEEGLL
jgi:nucleoside-diphosphate-sugar epimerase